MQKQTLILDLDDTLIHCNKYFKESKNKFVLQMQEWFTTLSNEMIKQKQLELDVKIVEKRGLHSSTYIDSLVKTYRYFSKKYKRKVKDFEVDMIQKIGHSVFQVEVEPLPHMYEVLDMLQNDGHDLYLFTGGDVENQRRKIKELRLQSFFEDRIFIYEHKNTRALEELLEKINADKSTTWMIGNSLKTDIKPAIELGINAIHIPAENEWTYNIVDIDIQPNGTFAELPSLLELPEFLREYILFNKAI
nr:HAD family hydrolase [Neobacillus sp. Marseille-Q6967]